ncbi:Uncharacterised protein [Yersinia ruckeri]|uniref:Uncharacterized protein n=1 Tax=Yersinia ruckeri TaxID=29486 RepID=A0A380QJM7_YERRU|nr:Uncharacterised protein [Yersinia ruckeri]
MVYSLRNESVEGLDSINDKLQGMGQFAREGVQFIVICTAIKNVGN